MIVYIDKNDNVCTCTLMSSVPEGTTGYEVDPPLDKEYRGSWNLNAGVLGYDMAKAKAEAHGKRRAKRVKDFEPYDAIIMLNIPGQDAANAEVARATIRVADIALQSAIDGSTTIDELKAVI